MLRQIDKPKCGYFKVRGRKRGVYRLWVPAEIRDIYPTDPLTGETLDRAPERTAFIDGRRVPLDWVWLSGQEITEDEWEWLKAKHAIRKM